MKKIRVAFFAESLLEDFDGAVRTMYQLIDRIPNNRFEFKFITAEKPVSHNNLDVIEVPSVRLPINHSYKMALSFLVKSRLESELKDFNPDVIHIATPSALGNFAVNYANLHRIPSISIYHTNFLSYIDYYFEKIPAFIPQAKKIMINILQNFYNKCDQVYVPTNLMKSELSTIGVFSNHLQIWKRGLKEGMFSPEKRDTSYLNKITGNTNRNVLFVSRLVNEKNIKTLARIYKSAMFQSKPYNFIIAGEGYGKERLQKEMKSAYFLGNLSHEELSKVYASSDAFLFPSITETYGNVVVEAMASGLPCIIANGGGPVEFIENGKSGFICNPNDPMDYLDKLEQLFSDEDLRLEFVKNGLELAEGLSWESLANTYFEDLTMLSSSQYLKTA